MKKIYLLAAMALIVMSCSPNDEESYPTDELLVGTEWSYGTFQDDDFLDQKPNEEINEEIYYDKFLEDYFPDVELVCTIGEASCKEDESTSEHTVSAPRAKLIFNNRASYYGDSGYTETITTKMGHYSQTTTYVPQNYTSTINPYISLKVTKDAITLHQTNPYTGQQAEHIYLKLNNFKHTKTWNKTISADTASVYNDIVEETFSYQRNGNEVILTNSNKKWIGTLDTGTWTLSFVQVVPEKKELPTFNLK